MYWQLTFVLAFISYSVSQKTEKCCITCSGDKVKYYSIDDTYDKCGESCINPKEYNKFHIFEKNLKIAPNDTICSDIGYPTYYQTETHGFWPISIEVDIYDH